MNKISSVLDFWFGARDSAEFGRPRKFWFEKNESFDAELRAKFGALQIQAASGRLDAWQSKPAGALALIILLDQFPRNMYRGTRAAFACDAHALRIARNAVARGFDHGLIAVQRWFVYLPYEHSEDIATQRESLRLFSGMRNEAAGAADYARRHYDIVARFDRFPHRNAILGRESTAEELDFLKQPGSGF